MGDRGDGKKEQGEGGPFDATASCSGQAGGREAEASFKS